MSPEADVVERAEATLLSALLSKRGAGRLDEIRDVLANHSFRNNLHALLFSALQQLSSAPGEDRVARMMAFLTRRGFPDVALEEFLREPLPVAEAVGEALATLRSLHLGRL
jgi:hypothetical protein